MTLDTKNVADLATRPTEKFSIEEELALVYKAIADTRNGIVITDHLDPEEPVIYVNKAFEIMTGFDKAEIIGKNCRLLQAEEDSQPARTAMRDALSKGLDLKVEIHNYRKDGSEFWNELALSPIKDRSGKVSHYIGVLNDITRRRIAEDALRFERDILEERVAGRTQELEELNINLTRSNNELQDFAYVASHDLQEPLRKIQAFGNLLESEYIAQLDGNGMTYINRMQDAAERMRCLISDLLSYSRVTTNAQSLKDIDLNQILSEVLSDMESDIAALNANIIYNKLPTFHADPIQMRQLFQNLISNAIKFHKPDKPPEVRITSRIEKGFVIISVQDNGIGFDEKYADKIFTIFQRLHGKESYSGTGIGLAVVRKIVDRHNGTITSSSSPGHGATFTITLPK